MKALVWHGKEDVRCDTVSDPSIEHPRDAILKVTSCAICGSDLHLFHNFIPAMLPGDIMGHEMMGEVVEVGSGVNGRLKEASALSYRSQSSVESVSSASAATFPSARRPTETRKWPIRYSAMRPLACSATHI
jgi:NADPH:quinone reductase-like Zn-dependent oxidoreductase